MVISPGTNTKDQAKDFKVIPTGVGSAGVGSGVVVESPEVVAVVVVESPGVGVAGAPPFP